MTQTLLEALEYIGARSELDLRAWAIAFARVLPSALLVPAFGLQGVAAPARTGLALAMAMAVAPGVEPIGSVHLGLAFLIAIARGLPVAIGAAAVLWAAMMAGGLADNLRSSHERSLTSAVDLTTNPTSALLGMLVAIAFLESGGAARIAAATILVHHGAEPLLGAVMNLQAAISIAIAAAVPLVVVSIVVEVAGALAARAANPAELQSILAPLRSLTLLGVLALLLDRMVSFLMLFAGRTPA